MRVSAGGGGAGGPDGQARRDHRSGGSQDGERGVHCTIRLSSAFGAAIDFPVLSQQTTPSEKFVVSAVDLPLLGLE